MSASDVASCCGAGAAGPLPYASGAGGGASAMAGGFSLRLGDFGSAVDAETLQPQLGLYGAAGPTVDEETAEYQPPEASLFGVPFEASDPTTYDLWSFGIVVLEALLGTPLVISLSSRAEALLQLRLQRARHRDGAAYPSAAQLRRLREGAAFDKRVGLALKLAVKLHGGRLGL